MTTATLPAELETLNTEYHALRKPDEPFLEDRVKDSEAADGGLSILVGLGLASFLPWWADAAVEGDLEGGWQDYAVVAVATLFSVGTYTTMNGLPWWEIYSYSFLSAVASAFVVFGLHLFIRKCVIMVVYNRIFRRKWMVTTRAEDARKYQNDCDSYPDRMQSYISAKSSKETEIMAALETYNASSTDVKLQFTTRGIVPVTNAKSLFDLAGTKARGLLGRFLSR